MGAGLGTLIAPGVGTAIGAAAGFILDAVSATDQWVEAQEALNNAMNNFRIEDIVGSIAQYDEAVQKNLDVARAYADEAGSFELSDLSPRQIGQDALNLFDVAFGTSSSEFNKARDAALEADRIRDILTGNVADLTEAFGLNADSAEDSQDAINRISEAWKAGGGSAEGLQKVLEGGYTVWQGQRVYVDDLNGVTREYFAELNSGPAKMAAVTAALNDLREGTVETSEGVNALESSLRELQDPQVRATRSNWRMRDSLKAFRDALQANGGELDRTAKDLLLTYAENAREAALATIDATGSVEKGEKKWKAARREILRMADSWGLSKDEVAKYLEQHNFVAKLDPLKIKVDSSEWKDLLKLADDWVKFITSPMFDDPVTPAFPDSPNPDDPFNLGDPNAGRRPVNPSFTEPSVGRTTVLPASSSRTGGVGDVNVTVNNPVPERTTESVSSLLRRKGDDGGWAA